MVPSGCRCRTRHLLVLRPGMPTSPPVQGRWAGRVQDAVRTASASLLTPARAATAEPGVRSAHRRLGAGDPRRGLRPDTRSLLPVSGVQAATRSRRRLARATKRTASSTHRMTRSGCTTKRSVTAARWTSSRRSLIGLATCANSARHGQGNRVRARTPTPAHLWVVGPGSIDPPRHVFRVLTDGRTARFARLPSLPKPLTTH